MRLDHGDTFKRTVIPRFKFRTTFNGKQILMKEFEGPSFIGGRVDSSIRERYWADANASDAQDIIDLLHQLTVPRLEIIKEKS